MQDDAEADPREDELFCCQRDMDFVKSVGLNTYEVYEMKLSGREAMIGGISNEI